MKFFVSLLVVGTLLTAGSRVFGQDSREQFMTIKLFGGYNFWVLGSAAIPSETSYVSAGGFSFGGDILFLNPKGIQLGIGVAYLPMLSASSNGVGGAITMIPITADIVFNTGFFYTDLGLGFAFLGANLNASAFGMSTNYTWNAPDPGFIIKTGVGLNFKIIDFLGLDVGAALYLPISDFGLSDGQINPFLGIILFSQFNIRAGICFYI